MPLPPTTTQMIVNLQPEGWEIIYHRAHALLAAQIAGLWHTCHESNRRYETVAAISHHDDLEKEWEGNQLTPAGAPLDFTLDQKEELPQLSRHIQEALYRGRWVALLTSMHCCFLKQGNRDEPEVADFLEEQYQHQKQWRQALDVTKDEAVAAYDFMRWCDRLSLILCQHQIPAGGRRLEVITNYEGQRYSIWQAPSGNLQVDPWPFSLNKFSISVEACYLSQLQYDSNDALIEALQIAPRKILTWQFSHHSDD